MAAISLTSAAISGVLTTTVILFALEFAIPGGTHRMWHDFVDIFSDEPQNVDNMFGFTTIVDFLWDSGFLRLVCDIIYWLHVVVTMLAFARAVFLTEWPFWPEDILLNMGKVGESTNKNYFYTNYFNVFI